MSTLQNPKKLEAPAWLPGNRKSDLAFDLFVIFGVIVLVVTGLSMQANDSDFQWLTRFGAVAVALCIVLEYRQLSYANLATKISIEWASGVGGPHVFDVSPTRKFIGYFAHVGIVLFTAVAGFGDLLFM